MGVVKGRDMTTQMHFVEMDQMEKDTRTDQHAWPYWDQCIKVKWIDDDGDRMESMIKRCNIIDGSAFITTLMAGILPTTENQ